MDAIVSSLARTFGIGDSSDTNFSDLLLPLCLTPVVVLLYTVLKSVGSRSALFLGRYFHGSQYGWSLKEQDVVKRIGEGFLLWIWCMVSSLCYYTSFSSYSYWFPNENVLFELSGRMKLPILRADTKVFLLIEVAYHLMQLPIALYVSGIAGEWDMLSHHLVTFVGLPVGYLRAPRIMSLIVLANNVQEVFTYFSRFVYMLKIGLFSHFGVETV